MTQDPGLYIIAKFKNYGPSVFEDIDAVDKRLRQVKKKAGAVPVQVHKDFVSEAAQTMFRESETQFLEWDVTEAPAVHPDKFPGGFGLHLPVLYDPAWPVHIAHKKAGPKPWTATTNKAMEVGSWALTGMTLSQKERRPVKQTLCFPHRSLNWPFRQPPTDGIRVPIFEPCVQLTLQEIDEIEEKITCKSVLGKC